MSEVSEEREVLRLMLGWLGSSAVGFGYSSAILALATISTTPLAQTATDISNAPRLSTNAAGESPSSGFSVTCSIHRVEREWNGVQNSETETVTVLISTTPHKIQIQPLERSMHLRPPVHFEVVQISEAFVTGNYSPLRSGGNFVDEKGFFFLDRSTGAGFWRSTAKLTNPAGGRSSEKVEFSRCEKLKPKF